MADGRTIRNVGLRLSRHRRVVSALHASLRRAVRTVAIAIMAMPAAFVVLAPAVVAPAIMYPAAAARAPLKATLSITTSDGYARLVFTAGEYIDATTKLSGHVLIITFKQPIDASVDRAPEQAPDYIGAARRDPDGSAIRLALSQDVTVNMMAAGEKLFIDLLPSSWTGAAPSLPQDVVTELARRAHEAERQLQRERELAKAKFIAPIRLHVATQPTFTRYVFDVTDQTAVAADRAKDRLVLNFAAPLTFDLADAQAALPKGVQAIDSELDQDSSLVRFVFATGVDVRTFRDEKGYVVDIVNPDDAAEQAGPATVPAKSAGVGMLTPEAAAAAVNAAASGGSQLSPSMSPNLSPNLPPAPAVEPPSPRRGGQSSAAPVAVPTQVAQAVPQVAQTMSPALAMQMPALLTPAMPKPAMPTPAMPTLAMPTLAMQARPLQMPALPPGVMVPPVVQAAPATAPAVPVPPPQAPAKMAAASPQAAPGESALPAAAPPQAPPGGAAPASPQAESQQPASQKPALQQFVPSSAAVTPAAPAPAAIAPAAAAPAVTAPADKPRQAAAPQPASPPAASPHNVAAGAVGVELSRDGANLKLSFPFNTAVPAAMFRRADTLWIVFDAKTPIDLSALDNEATRTIRGFEFSQQDDADIIRLKLNRPHLASIDADGGNWTVEIGDTVLDPPRALEITRNIVGPNRASVSIGFEEPQRVRRLVDPEVGDKLLVATGYAPARGFIDTQDFIEFRVLASMHGVVVEPLADDIAVGLAPDKVVIDRPSGLTLSPGLQTLLHGRGSPANFDSQTWGSDRQGAYEQRQANLIYTAAEAPENKRLGPRLDLARFYLARDMYPEAKGVLDVALAADKPAAENASAIVLRAIAEIMMDRPDDALKDLSDPTVGDQHDAALWRALAYSQQGQWAKARQSFKSVEAAVATLPIELQRVALKDEMRAAVEAGDFNSAQSDLNDFQTIGVPRDMQPSIAVLMGRLDEGLGRNEDALSAYRTAADSWDRPAAAQGRLRETLLQFSQGDLKRDDVIAHLESLTTVWRGDETEIEALKVLAHLYTEEGRYRDAFYTMRSAMAAHPNSAMTREIQDEAAATFDSLFLAGKGDAMPPIDALALFYDFRELTPVGGRGDEMIRHLADRLVAVDLLDQAADLLQYQVDNRLQGAARAQIATRLAVVYLMNKKADRALAVLRGSRVANLSGELRDQRLLLEGRALSDTGRPDLALEVIANLDGREVVRLRADILWLAKRWDQSAEQIELMYSDRYKDFTPLSDVEQQDILRAEIGYALSSDTLGLTRFREKFAAKMAETPDARVFDIVSAPLGSSGDQFAAIAHAATSIDTLEGFLREMKARYPDSNSTPTVAAAPPGPGAAAPAGQTVPPAAPPAKASGHTAQNAAASRQANAPIKPASTKLSSAKLPPLKPPSSKPAAQGQFGRDVATAALENR